MLSITNMIRLKGFHFLILIVLVFVEFIAYWVPDIRSTGRQCGICALLTVVETVFQKNPEPSRAEKN
jgi:hypothetical protein